VKRPDELTPAFVGGGTVNTVTIKSFSFDDIPSRFEYGTPNIPGVIGLGRAVKYVEELGAGNVEAHLKGLSRYCAKRLYEIPGLEIYGPENRGSLVSFNVKGLNSHDVAMILDETKKTLRGSLYAGKISFVTYILAGMLIIIATIQGIANVWYSYKGPIWYGYLTLLMLFINASVWWYVAAGICANVGKLIDMHLEA